MLPNAPPVPTIKMFFIISLKKAAKVAIVFDVI